MNTFFTGRYRFSYSLRTALILQVLVPLCLVLGVTVYLGLQALERTIEARMQKDIELVARALQLPVSYSLEREQAGTVQRALESALRIGRVYGAYVFDAAGRRIATAGIMRPGVKPVQTVIKAAGQGRHGQYEEIEGRRVYSYFVPLIDSGGRFSGLLQVTRRGGDIDRYLSGLRNATLIALMLVLAGITTLLAFTHHRASGRYLHNLTASMERVTGGERDHRASDGGPREISLLATTLNTMLDSIARAEYQLAGQRRARNALEQRLREQEKLAAVGKLAAGVAHELGAPLSVIDGRACRLLHAPKLSSRQQQMLATIRQEGQRMTRIVQQLLDYGRGSEQPRRLAASHDMALQALAIAATEDSTIRERVQLQGPHPGPPVHVDPLRIEQALINLLRNAAQASAARIRLSWRQDAAEVVFSVDDSGPGIPAAVRPRIFEPFYTTKPPGAGTGLGLAVVHGIATEQGGHITVSDSDLGGARFELRLPLPAAEPDGDAHD